MKRLLEVKERLMESIYCEVMEHLENVNTKELGEAIDMIKDIEKAIYYCTKTKMLEHEEMSDSHNNSWQTKDEHHKE